jgi:2-dehydro-3-deoxyglucarate aldolase/4-hydroxy-2-oxoheptanedioate aldolase
MDLPQNRFKRAIAEHGGIPIGTWLMSAAGSTAEALGCAGFDFLVVDMEHVPIDVPQAIDILRAIAGTPAQPVVRIAWNDAVIVKRVMDAGAQTLMFPFVQGPDEARRAVAATRYPPEGTRGVAAMHRASRFGNVTGYLGKANAEACVIIQIETPAALERVAEIAAVPGVDSLFLGPGDLSASMGHLGDIAHADVQQQIARAAAECRRLGKPIGIVGPTPQMVARFVEYGYSWVAVGSDMAMLLTLARDYLAQLRTVAPARSAPAPDRAS